MVHTSTRQQSTTNSHTPQLRRRQTAETAVRWQDKLRPSEEATFSEQVRAHGTLRQQQQACKAFKRLQPGVRLIIDLCAGHNSMAQYYLEQDPMARVVCVEKYLSKEESLKNIPPHMHHRITFVQEDVENLTLERIIAFATDQGLQAKHIHHIHWSPDCTTYSTAETNQPYRLSDGTINPNTTEKKQAKAKLHDRVFSKVSKILMRYAEQYSHTLLTIENPVGAMYLRPSIQKAINDPASGWQLLETDYCMTADLKLDGDAIWTQKPTHIVCRGVEPGFCLPQCPHGRRLADRSEGCRYRFPEGSGQEGRHLKAIRIDSRSAPGQTKQEEHMRHAIPLGLIDKLHKAHAQHRVREFNEQARELILACTECEGCTGPSQVHPVQTRTTAQASAATSTPDPSVPAMPTQTKQAEPQPSTSVPKKVKKAILGEHATPSKAAKLQALWQLLHARYGHASMKRIRLPDVLQNATKHIDFSCPTCSAAKACRRPHSGKLKRATYAMKRVHTDLQGPFRVPDLDGHRYAAVFVDCYTRRKWLYLLKDKAAYSATMLRWLASVGTAPERMRSDFGGEFLGTNMNQFLHNCLERNIAPEKSVPVSPEQNGVAERSFRTLIESTRAILLTAGLDKQYWGYAMRHAAYIDERLKASDTGKTPYELWHGYTHDADDMRTFGAILYYRHHERNPSIDPKLDNPGHRALYLGQCPDTGGTFVQDLDVPHKPVRITRDVQKHSIDESHVVFKEPLAVQPDDWALLEVEYPDATDPTQLEECDQLLPNSATPASEDTLKYWRARQMFAQERRQELHSAAHVPQKIEETIQKEWTMREHSKARTARERRIAGEQLRAHGELASGPTNEPPGQPPRTNLEHVPCSDCHSKECTPKNDIVFCDRCDRGWHQKCIRMVRLPLPSDDWYCHECLKIGDKVSVLWSDGIFHDGHVTMKYTREVGVDITYTNGQREQINLNTCRWRPLYDDNIERHVHALNLWGDPQTVMPDWSQTPGQTIPDQLPRGKDQVIFEIEAQPCPKSHAEIMKKLPPSERDKWQISEEKEWRGIISNGAIKLVHRSKIPPGSLVVPSKWVYRIKPDGTYKSRLCVLGNKLPKHTRPHEHTLGKRKHDEATGPSTAMPEATPDTEVQVSAPTPRLSTIRTMIDAAAKEDLEFDTWDVEQAFMKSQCSRTMYIHLPPGLNTNSEYKALLVLNVYGTAEGPFLWHGLLHNWFTSQKFIVNPHDPCMYMRWNKHGQLTRVSVHVDDLGVLGTREDIDELKAQIKAEFSIVDEGPLGCTACTCPLRNGVRKHDWRNHQCQRKTRTSRYLGIQVERDEKGFVLHQKTLIENLLKRAATHMPNIAGADTPAPAKPLDKSTCPVSDQDKKMWSERPYRSYLGGVGYIMLGTRPDLAFAYQQLARFNSCYGEDHWKALQHLLAYMRKSKDTHVMRFTRYGGSKLVAYCDADWNANDSHRSTTGWIVFSGRNPISWCSRSQKATSRSTCEAEYISLSSCSVEVIYLQMLNAVMNTAPAGTYSNSDVVITDRVKGDCAATVWSDSQAALKQGRDPDGWVADKLRHLRTAWHFFRQYVQSEEIIPRFCRGGDNCSDILTKGFGTGRGGTGTPCSQKASDYHRHARFCLNIPEDHYRQQTTREQHKGERTGQDEA